MRLTLRNMLACLDDVLDPADAALLSEKIKESEFASNLVSRIRTTICQPRLGAPPIDGKGIGADANSVSEYLDLSMPPEQVADFERICLESDGHLAEVAACHQILYMVIVKGKPARVPPPLRERAYRFGTFAGDAGSARKKAASAAGEGDPHRLDLDQPGGASTSAAGVAAHDTGKLSPSDTPRPGETREKSEVPEYLREGRRRSRLTTLAVAACVLVLLLGVASMVAMKFFPGPDVAVVDPADDPKPENVEGPSAPELPVAPPESGSDSDPANPPVERPAVPAEAGEPAATNPPAPATPEDANDSAALPVTTPPASETSVPAEPTPRTTPNESPATIELPAANPPPATVTPPLPPPPEENPIPLPAETGSDSPLPVEPVPPEVPAELEPVDVGRFLSGDKVLARLTPDSQWLRLPTNTPIRSGDQAIALPAFRPQVALTSDTTLTLDGPTRVEFLRPGEEDEPRLEIDYGRLLAITVAKGGSPLGLQFGNLHGTVRLADADTMLAIEVTPLRNPGVDPETHVPELDIRVICLTGRVDWVSGVGSALAIAAGESLVMRQNGIGQIEKLLSPPAWVDDKATSLPDRDVARQIEQRIVADRALSLTLSEVVSGPRADLRSLAVRSLSYLDNHDTLISALNDAAQRSSWSAEFDAVTDALNRSPESAAAVRKALEKSRGAGAKELYRLLWGYSQEDLAAGADAKLVEYLDHDAQEFRVLAIENLRRITGATHLYRPEYNPQRRKSYVQTWREDLEQGKIRYPEAATPPAI